MPGNVPNAAPTTVLPSILCAAFARQVERIVAVNEYKSGERQVRSRVTLSRGRWTATIKRTSVQMAALRAFFLARKGKGQAFWFYDPFEVAAGQPPGSNWDASGTSTTGRYAVRFDSSLSRVLLIPRSQVQIALIEIS